MEKSVYIHTAGYFFDCLWLVDRQSLREPDELFTGNIPGLQDVYTAAESRHLPIKAPSYDLCDDHRTETHCLRTGQAETAAVRQHSCVISVQSDEKSVGTSTAQSLRGVALAIIKDLCTKKVVGYAFSNRIDTALTLAALRMAVKREHPAPGLMFHSDRGVQYAAAAYREKLEKLGFVQSMSRKGEPHDNAVAENFFSCLKCELVYLTSYATRRQAQNSIFRYIEGFYNPVRPHSSIGWLSPMEYARQLNWQNVA